VTFDRAIAIPNITMVMERVGLHEPFYTEVTVGPFGRMSQTLPDCWNWATPSVSRKG
jgi:hypothetical protein